LLRFGWKHEKPLFDNHDGGGKRSPLEAGGYMLSAFVIRRSEAA